MSLKSQKRYYHFLRRILKLKSKFSVKIDVIGLENVPKKGPAILVGNHRSGKDPSIISIVIPRYISWVTAAYMKKVPFMAWMIKKTGMVLMDVHGNVSPSSLKKGIKCNRSG